MRSTTFAAAVLLALPLSWIPAAAQTLAEWRFEELPPPGELKGNAWLVPGVRGRAIQFDGITGHITQRAYSQPPAAGGFTIEGWVALGAYPFNWAPILQQEGDNAGFFFGAGDRGQVAFRIVAGGKWRSAETSATIPLRTWTHVAAVYSPTRGIAVYLNGRRAAGAEAEGTYRPAPEATVWIGKNQHQMEQSHPVHADGQTATGIVLDGILDEVVVSVGAKDEARIREAATKDRPANGPPLKPRVLPAGPPGPGPFGAFYTKLEYYRGWDEYWRTAGAPDIVVRFGPAPYRLVFWRGTSYIPHWVTENGIWYTNEFVESFQKGLRGSAEPMSDKQCRLSSVRVLESNEARAQVHWRYPQIDVNYKFAWEDPETGWGDWTDEVYTLYPDGVGVRRITVHTSTPEVRREFHESIVVMSPGMSPADAIEPGGLTLIDDYGTAHTWSWEKETPPKFPQLPAGATIQVVNTKSRFKPFAAGRSVDKPVFDIYANDIRRDVNIYPWWNHWPTAFEPSNGRYALAADRASHSSISHMNWQPYESGRGWLTKTMLHGLTDKPAGELAAIVRSWSLPPRLRLTAEGYSGGDYDPGQRAYLIARKPEFRGNLEFTLEGSERSPARNLALVVTDWGQAEAVVRIDGKEMSRAAGLRYARRQSIATTDLVVWIPLERAAPAKVAIARR